MWHFPTHWKFNVVMVIRGLGFLYRFQERPDSTIQTRGPWGTSLTWETSSNQQTHIITLILEGRKPIICFFVIKWSLSVKPWIFFTQGCLCQVWLKKTLLSIVSIFRDYNYLPYEKGEALHLSKQEFPSLKDALCPVWLKMPLWFLRKSFKFRFNTFSLFRNYIPMEKGVVLY